MFCRNCGIDKGNAAFCKNCGAGSNSNSTAVNSGNRIVEDGHIRFQLEPKFSWGYRLIANGARMIPIILMLMFMIGPTFIDITRSVNTQQTLFTFGPFLFTIVLVIIIDVIKVVFEWMQYQNLKFNFYATKMEYVDGFLNKMEKEIKYKHIRNVMMTQRSNRENV